jgi:hypothetical protein
MRIEWKGPVAGLRFYRRGPDFFFVDVVRFRLYAVRRRGGGALFLTGYM